MSVLNDGTLVGSPLQCLQAMDRHGLLGDGWSRCRVDNVAKQAERMCDLLCAHLTIALLLLLYMYVFLGFWDARDT